MRTAGHGGPDTLLAQVPRQSVPRFVSMLRRSCAGPSSVRNGALRGVARAWRDGEATTARVPSHRHLSPPRRGRAAHPRVRAPWPRPLPSPRGFLGAGRVTYL